MKNYFVLIIFILSTLSVFAQQIIKGKVTDATDGFELPFTTIYGESGKEIALTDENGFFELDNDEFKGKQLTFFMDSYKLKNIELPTELPTGLWEVQLESLSFELSELVIQTERKRLNNFRRLLDVEGMTINAGRKNEVVVLSDLTVNKSTNNARQIFSKVVGLTVNEGSEGGLQLNIGGRGLNPNRTANFNTRQNGYDISADVLGYPESYYSPASEGVREIQVIRGAAGLQYGTQFGGMVNFKMKNPIAKPIKLGQRLSYGSFDTFTSFTELSGTNKKFSYYTYYNYKQGSGYRPNANFSSQNAFANINYKFDERNSLHFDWVKFYYLAKQPGGLTDYMFFKDPTQSNRSRNYFKVDWNILNLRYQHIFNDKARYSLQLFGLKASRSALGRIRGKRLTEVDEEGTQRDLLIGRFNNWGAETKFIQNYQIREKKQTLLVGAKYYQSANESEQGGGSSGTDANFNFAREEFPNYERQSFFKYPNLNLAFFAENIFRINDKTTITPGLRVEKIRTESKGKYRVIFKHAGVIYSDSTYNDNVLKDRSVVLLGLGVAHKNKHTEWYGNVSQNYRSVTFSDIHSDVLGLSISPEITDEKGFSSDIGFRGELGTKFNFDTSIYALMYGGKIGEYWRVNDQGGVERYRDNVGNALTYGLETMLDWNINETFWQKDNIRLAMFVNTSFTGSKYIKSEVPNIEGNQVEFVPLINLKSGLNVGFANFVTNIQFTYMSSQFSDATNRVVNKLDNTTGIFGKIPAYYVMDVSASYKFNKYITLEGTVNNFTNNKYFTQRATGYPGPGIIPSQPINAMLTLDISF